MGSVELVRVEESVVVVDVAARLEELAKVVVLEDRASREHLAAAVYAGIRCGLALLEARRHIGSAGWREWLEGRGFLPPRASRYMRLAETHSLGILPATAFEAYVDRNGITRQPSITRALQYVPGLVTLSPVASRDDLPRIGPEARAEIVRLHEAGRPQRHIAWLLGISRTSVRRILDPEEARRMQLRQAEKRRIRRAHVRAANAALKEQEKRRALDLAAKQRGGREGKAYTAILDAVGHTDAALTAATDKEVRAAWNALLMCLYHCEDLWGKADRAMPAPAVRKKKA